MLAKARQQAFKEMKQWLDKNLNGFEGAIFFNSKMIDSFNNGELPEE
jgi:hypothetical protein